MNNCSNVALGGICGVPRFIPGRGTRRWVEGRVRASLEHGGDQSTVAQRVAGET